MKESTEFEMMRSLHTLWVKGLITFEQVELLLIQNNQLELTFLNKNEFMAETLDGKTKYRLGEQ
jgi:hypothetical protein